MFDVLKNFYNTVSIIDLIYLFITILSLVSCYKKGFVLSILSMAKWLLAYIITLIIFPKIKPYVSHIVDNEYVLDVGLGIVIFVGVIFLVLLVNKGISKAVNYTGIGGLDATFGIFFGFLWLATVPPTAGLVSFIFGTKYMGLLYGIVFLSHQIGSFFGAYLGGLFHDLYGSYDYAWYLAIALSVFAALIHLPIKEQPVLRLKTE